MTTSLNEAGRSGDQGAPPAATGLSPSVEPASGLAGSAASIPSAGAIRKVANVGTRMFRRSDVLARLKRHAAIYRNNMRAAEREGNEEWRDVQLQKLRTVTALLDDVLAKCPVFENASAIEARRAETRSGSVADESAVPQADAQTPPESLP